MKLVEVYRNDNGYLLCGDCLQEMKNIPDNSVDLVFTSPPYSDIKKHHQSEIDDNYVHGVDENQYPDWICNVSKEICRVLKPSGSFVLNLNSYYIRGTYGKRSLYVFKSLIKIAEQSGLTFAQDLIYVKLCPIPCTLATKYFRFRDATEYLFWFVKDTRKTKIRIERILWKISKSSLESITRKAKCFKNNRMLNPSGHSTNYQHAYETMLEKDGVTPMNYVVLSNAQPMDIKLQNIFKEFNISHPARFPIVLPEYFIHALTDENDVVLDPFVGSGTTLLAADKLNRRWIGIDISEKYCTVIKTYFERKFKIRKIDDYEHRNGKS